jgi:hydroxypyruvate isomerase
MRSPPPRHAPFGLRYASHMGFRSPDRPLFLEHVGSLDPAEHVGFAAQLGFKGVMHPWALGTPEAEVEAFSRALDEYGLEGSCVVFAPMQVIRTPVWGAQGRAAFDAIKEHLERAFTVARRIRSRTIAVIATVDASRPLGEQRAQMVEHLRRAGDLALDGGFTLVVETMRTLPDMLLRNMEELHGQIRKADHPAVRMIFDTHHCAALDGVAGVRRIFSECFDEIGLIQIASYPDKTEIGTGEIDFVPLLAEAMRRRFSGLVELEHLWSEPGLEGEVAGLERFLRADAAAQALATECRQEMAR